MSDKEPIRLLILEPSLNRAEELIVLLRTAGHATRAHQIGSEADFSSKISKQPWDLILAANEANGFTIQTVISQLQMLDKDIPVIMLADNRDPGSITEGMKMGAIDVALDDDDERLLLIIQRELTNLETRRQKRRTEVELKETDRRNKLLLDSSTTAIAYVHEGMHIYTNQAYAELFGYEDADEYAGIPIIDLITNEDQGKFKTFLKSFEKDETKEAEFGCVDSEGETMLTILTMSPATYDSESCTQAIFRPLVDSSVSEDRVKEVSSQDLLTGLYNRQYFLEVLDQAVDNANQGKQSSIIFYMVIDHFPRMRSDAGISNADVVLGDLANVIRGKVPNDHLMARFGDDVFTVLIEGSDKAAAEALAETIRATAEGHMSQVSGKNYQLTLSIGLSMIAENTPTVEQAISRAYQASDSIMTGNAIAFYEPKRLVIGEGGQSLTIETLKTLVSDGLDKDKFELDFQPIISLRGEDEGQFEVLLRLQDEDGNVLQPGQFMGPAEEAGLLRKIDRWVVFQSIKQLARQREAGGRARLFINVSHKTLADEEFLPWVSVSLKASRLTSDSIVFQLHENDATSYIKQAAKFTKGLQALHIKSSISHFGCSLNPFNLLKHLTPDIVKLDSSFANHIDESEEKQEELIEMVRSLQTSGVLTAISGIEHPSTLPTLFTTGINYIQGNYISEPLNDMDYDFSSEGL